MAAFTDAFENTLIDVLFRGQNATINGKTLSWSAAPTLYMALTTTAPTDSAAGTEVVGGSYARQPIAASLANMAGSQAAGSTTASSGTGGTTSNNAAIAFASMPAATLVGFEIWDALTAGTRLVYGNLTGQPISVSSGNTVTFSAGQVTIQVDN